MVKIKKYEFLLNNSFFKKFNKMQVKQKLNMIFNASDAKINWSNVPIYMVKK